MSTSSPPSRQPAKPDLRYREPLTWDLVYWFLNKTAFHPLALLVYPALAYGLARSTAKVPEAYPAASYALLRSLLATSRDNEYRWLGRLFWFSLFKNINSALTRYTRNHGQWRRDRPDWKTDVVVITGGAAGIGKAAVEVLSHEKHAKIAVLDMSAPTYAPAPAGSPEILYFKTDVTNPAEVKAAADEIRARYGAPSVLINCAGIASGNTILDTSLDGAERVWRINTLANWITVQEFLPAMISRNHGHVVTVASSASYMCLPQASEYASSKAAALAFHEILHSELAVRYDAPRVRASVCTPTKVRTALGEGMADHNLEFFTPNLMPIQVGRALVDAVESGLCQNMIMPQGMRILPWMRAVPYWVRRGVQVVGKTDTSITYTSAARSLRNGYGADWTGKQKAMRDATLQRADAEQARLARKTK